MIKSRVFSSGYSGNNDLRSDYLLINKPPPCEYIDPANKNYPPKNKKKIFLYIFIYYTFIYILWFHIKCALSRRVK